MISRGKRQPEYESGGMPTGYGAAQNTARPPNVTSPSRLLLGVGREHVRKAMALQEQVVRPDVLGRPTPGCSLAVLQDPLNDPCHDAPRDLFLNGEDILNGAVISIGPEVRSSGRLDELGCDPNPMTRPTHAALDDVTCAQHAADLAYVDVPSPKGKGGVPRNHKKLAEARQLGDNILCDPVTEIDLLGISAHVLKGQNGDCGPAREL
jgi:hypothetical protein